MDKLQLVLDKVYENHEQFSKTLNTLRFQNQKIVFTNGCFDILHRGHIKYLAKAASLGNFMVIGLNADASVKKLKGDKRPVTNENDRALQIAALHFVNAVIIFQEDTPYNLIEFIKPDFLVKGGDYEVEKIVGYDIVTKNGGEVTTIPLVKGYSTTSVLDKINKL